MRLAALVCLSFATASFAQVAVTSPTNNSTVGSTVQVVATISTSSCSKGISASGVYVDNVLQNVTNGNKLNTPISLTPGKHYVVVLGWDYCGGAVTAPLNLTVPTNAGVTVTSPVNGSTVGNQTAFIATATSNCPAGVAAVGVYVNDKLVITQPGSSLNTTVTLGVGKQSAVVQQWDNCGGVAKTPVSVTVTGTTLKNVHTYPGWNQWGQLPPIYDICESTAACPGVTWSMKQNQKNITLSGNSTQFNLGGTVPYSAVLFSNPVIGQGNKMGLTDDKHVLMDTLHDFILDMDVYITDWSITQLQEFDINMYGKGIGMEWGTECNHLNGNVWDYWDNVNLKWVPTNVPCTMKNGWNHVTLTVHREANNDVTYKSVTVNNTNFPMNITVAPKKVPAGWWGMTVNYQIGGNYRIAPNTTYVDNMHFTYW